MLNIEEAKIDAWTAIADKLGLQYFREHFVGSCESYPSEESNELSYEYFIGFEGDNAANKWTVFARVSVNRQTREVTFLDYKMPNGDRMKNPIKPTSFA